ncbi:MAG: Epimerase family protein [Planctomycetaceae bacterium]|nr:Epimerase family protein [Planctomycetaceae bacterium]
MIEPIPPPRIVIAGGSGFLGISLANYLAAKGSSVIQGMSWIHELDLNRLFERALQDPVMRGPYIASAPNPVSQLDFMRELRRAVRMPIGLPAYSWMVRFGAKWLLHTDPELALYGRYVVSKRLEEECFEFQYPQLHDALQDLICHPTTEVHHKVR